MRVSASIVQNIVSLRRLVGELRVTLLACVALALTGTSGLSCIVTDLQYCASDAQCPMAQTDLGMQQLLCNPTAHVCFTPGPDFNCFTDAQCSEPHSPRCDTTTNTCTSCRVGSTTDTSCAHFQDRPVCASAPDGSGTTLCVACQTGADCAKETPICDHLQCRKCTSHQDCVGPLICDNGAPCTDSLVCIDDETLSPELAGLSGRCAFNGPESAGRVIYVNNQIDVASCPPDTNSGGELFTTPMCSLRDGFTRATMLGRHYIRVVGQKLDPQLQITSGSYAVIGAPAGTFKSPAAITTKIPAFDISGTASLTVDGMAIVDQSQGADTLVQCQGLGDSVPTLKLRRSILTGSAQVGDSTVKAAVNIINCNAVIDQNIIGVSSTDLLTTGPAHGIAIYISDSLATGKSSYLIQNNIIAGNLGAAVNLNSAGNPNFVVRFNTIVGNGRGTAGKASILCPNEMTIKEFSHSIVIGNSTSTNNAGSQFADAASCNIQDVVVGSAAQGSDQSLTVKDVSLDKDFSFLTGGDNSCCIDKVTPAAGATLPSLDVYGTARPQGTAWDIGAVEKPQ